MKRPLVLLLFLLVSTSVSAQWVQVGPPGGAVNVLRSVDRRVYAAGDAGLFVSSDAGRTWTRLFSVPGLALTQLLIDPRSPDTMYVIASQHPSYFGLLFTRTRLFKSVDAGMSWRELAEGLPAEKSIASLTIDAEQPSTLYAGLQCGVQYFGTRTIACDGCADVTAGAGVYKSLDGGETWFGSTMGLGGEDLCVRGIAADPKSTNVLYAYSETLISSWVTKNSRSTDRGATWTAADPNSPSRDLIVHSSGRRFAIANPADCRGCTPESAIVVSEDGQTWRTITDALVTGRRSVVAFAVDPRSEQVVYAATNEGLFVTQNGGVSWSRVSAPEFRGARSVLVDEADASVIYLATSTGLLVSRAAGVSWAAVVLPHQGTSLSALVSSPDGTLYGVLQDFDVPRTVVRSADQGRSWETLGAIGSPTSTQVAWWAGERPTVAVAPDGTFYGLSGDSPQVLKRYDGRQFVDVPFPTNTFPTALAADPRDPATLYVAAYPGELWKTTDRGATWRLLLHREGGAWTVGVAPTSPSTVYFSVGGSVYRSLDGGETWSESLSAGQVSGFAIPRDDPERVYALTCCSGGLMVSDDRGATWRPLRHPSDPRGVLIDPRDSNTLYLRYLDGPGVLKSTDGGATWVPFGGGLTSTVVNDLAADPASGRIYAATFRGGVFALSDPARRRVVRR